MNKAVSCSIIGATLLSVGLSAQEPRWFEVEMLIFSQTPPASLQETFNDTVTPIKPGRAYDLLTPRLQPDLTALLAQLPLCDTAAVTPPDYQFAPLMPAQLCIFEPQPASWQQSNLFAPRRTYSKLPYPAELPQQITGLGQHQTQPYLAEQASLQLSDIADKISRNTGSRLLLHTSWRQAPVTERRAIASRWFAGKNFSQQYDYWGQPVTDTLSANDNALAGVTVETDNTSPTDTAPSSDQLLSNIEQLLQQLNANSQLPDTQISALDSINSNEPLTVRNLPDQVWQLDGLFKLHLDHYLFVNTEFNLRLPADNTLQTLYIRQSRRVISGEIHYLDHPYLGIVLQIRRYEPPQEETGAENTSTSTATE